MVVLLGAVLALNLVAEGIAAVSLIGGLAPDASAAGPWALHYGFAVIAIASAGAWLWPHRREHAALTPVLGMLATFHAAVLVSLLRAGDQPAGVPVHAVLALAFLLLFALRGRIAAS